MIDAEEYRAAARESWDAAAAGWEKRRAAFQEAAEPVSRWLIDQYAAH